MLTMTLFQIPHCVTLTNRGCTILPESFNLIIFANLSSGDSDVFRRNGTVVDAAIATLFCNGIVNSHSMGIGGGFLMTLYLKEQNKVVTLNARETAPAASGPNMYAGNAELSKRGMGHEYYTVQTILRFDVWYRVTIEVVPESVNSRTKVAF